MMQRISRAADNIFYLATRMTGGPGEDPSLHDTPPDHGTDDEHFTPEQFANIYNLYHEGHKLGTHHREVHDWLSENDPLSALEKARDHAHEANIDQIVVSALASKLDAPDHVKYALPSWHGKGYNDGRGGITGYDGFQPFKGGWRYDPPTPEDPMRRNGPW